LFFLAMPEIFFEQRQFYLIWYGTINLFIL
jgi:hypothetical protein